MKWFKHMSDSSSDLFIQDMEAEFGDTGYTFWFKTLELLGRQTPEGTMEISENVWRKVIHSRRTDHLRRLYAFATERDKLVVETLPNGLLRVTCPKFIEFADEYTNRVKVNRDKLPTLSGQTPSRIEVEQNRKEVEKKERSNPPTLQEAEELWRERNYPSSECSKFWNYYESNGWRVGKNPMKNWRAAAAGWVSRSKQYAPTPVPFLSSSDKERVCEKCRRPYRGDVLCPNCYPKNPTTPPSGVMEVIESLAKKMSVK